MTTDDRRAAAGNGVWIRTFGCQMNEHDSEVIRGMLSAEGYVLVEDESAAGVILFNTCTIRDKAHQKAFSEIGRAKIHKRRPGVVIGVCGCVAQEERERLLARFPHVDLLFGPDQIWRLPELLERARAGERCAAIDLVDDEEQYRFLESSAEGSAPPPSAFVSIMKGCNGACSYCIVPSVRGREVCRDADVIVEEVRRLAARGTKEVTLLGQNVNAYGARRVQGTGTPFSRLLRRIADETTIQRIRFTSPHPRDVGVDLIREYADNEKLMPHLHLPVQAGSNAVLQRMRRGYSRERYAEIALALRAARSGMSITTDIIVGFCGETDDDFEETLSLMRCVGFESAFAFKYSPRPGTEAAHAFADDVPFLVKEERLARLLALQRATSRQKNEAQVGSIAPVLVIGSDRLGRGLLTGRSPENRLVHFAGKADCLGAIVPVRITAAHDNSLAGESAPRPSASGAIGHAV